MITNRIMTRLRAFVNGAGSIVDLSGLSHGDRSRARGGILEALRTDVWNVGNDFQVAIRTVKGNHGLDAGTRLRRANDHNELQE